MRHLIYGDLSPIVRSITPGSLTTSSTYDVVIDGDYFRPDTIVSVGGSIVNSITYVNQSQMVVNITTGSILGFFDVTIEVPKIGSSTYVDAIELIVITYKDLRLGGDVFTDGNAAGNNIRYRAGMSLVRDAAGMYFQGASPRSSWVKFEVDTRQRGQSKTLEWIMSSPSSFMMIGIGSDQTNETNTSQFSQSEVQAYFTGPTSMWGLYGNNGIVGSAGNQSDGSAIGAFTYKLKFEGDGSSGSIFTLYQLPSSSPADWSDESNIIKTITIGGTLDPRQTNIMPFIVPQNGGQQRFIAYTVY